MESLKKTQEKTDIKSSSFTFFSPLTDKKPLSYAAIKKHLLARLAKKEYSQLKKDIESYGLTSEELAQFFLKEGDAILEWSLGDDDSASLKCLTEIVPIEALQNIFRKDNLSIFETFLLGQAGLEDLEWYDSETEGNQIAKLKILLEIDADAIEEFVEEDATKEAPFLSEKIKSNYETALQQFKENAVPALSS